MNENPKVLARVNSRSMGNIFSTICGVGLSVLLYYIILTENVSDIIWWVILASATFISISSSWFILAYVVNERIIYLKEKRLHVISKPLGFLDKPKSYLVNDIRYLAEITESRHTKHGTIKTSWVGVSIKGNGKKLIKLFPANSVKEARDMSEDLMKKMAKYSSNKSIHATSA